MEIPNSFPQENSSTDPLTHILPKMPPEKLLKKDSPHPEAQGISASSNLVVFRSLVNSIQIQEENRKEMFKAQFV